MNETCPLCNGTGNGPEVEQKDILQALRALAEQFAMHNHRIDTLEFTIARQQEAIRVLGELALQQSPLTRQPNKYKTLWITDQKYTEADLRALFGLTSPPSPHTTT